MVENCFENGTYQLADLDGTLHASRVNGLRLKLYHARLIIVKKNEENEEGETVPLKNTTTLDAASLMVLFVVADHE